VEVEHRNVLNLLTALKRSIHGERLVGVRVSINAPLSFDASIKQLVLMLEGACLQIIPAQVRGDGGALLHFLQEHRVDVFDCTPSQLKLLVAAGLFDGEHAFPGVLLVGGEPIDAELWDTLARQRDRVCYNVYGPTECTVDSTIARVTEGKAPHIGTPISNARVYLVDAALRLVPHGTVGEIIVAGAGLARGYLGRPDLTAACFPSWVPPISGAQPERVYRTGDLARYREDGCLEFIGRRDEQVKIRGVRMELGEIANVARRHPLVRDAVVIARSTDQQLICYVVPKDSSRQLSPVELREHLAAWLPPTMVPTHTLVIDSFPLTDNGKLDKARLPTTAGLRPELKVSYAAPQSRTEQALAEIWRAVLGLDNVGVLDNSFDLGGHSLLLPQVQTAMESSLKVSVTLPQLIEFPTIQALARLLEGERGASMGDAGNRGARQREARARLKRRHETEGQLE
jgi:hypothetical protein